MEKKHYSHRIPQLQYAFGLFDIEKYLKGVCTFGFACRKIQDRYAPVKIYELNRLVLDDGIKNGASYFVRRCFLLFPQKPCYIVSYADANQGHHGYIYQALNGIYTGLSSKEKLVYLNEQLMHRRTLNSVFGTSSTIELANEYNIDIEEQEGKHRYFFLLGNKRERKQLRQKLGFSELEYPKGDNKRYDASYEPVRQGVLF